MSFIAAIFLKIPLKILIRTVILSKRSGYLSSDAGEDNKTAAILSLLDEKGEKVENRKKIKRR